MTALLGPLLCVVCMDAGTTFLYEPAYCLDDILRGAPMPYAPQPGDIFMACSDYPHTEGTSRPLDDYRAVGVEPESEPGLFGGNVGFLLGAGAIA